MRRATILLFPVAFTAFSTHAQTVPKPDGEWRGSLGAGLTASQGNNDTLTFSLNSDVVKQTDKDKLNGYLQSVYGRREKDGVTERTSDLIRTGGKYERDVNERKFGFGALDFERDKLINLNLRSVAAGGLGYHVVKREDLTFDVSTGPAYTRENYTADTRESFDWLLAEESTHAIADRASFRQRLSLYPSLNHSGEYRVVFDTGVVFRVMGRWSATISLSSRYQSNPLPGVEKHDLLLVTGLQYSFGPDQWKLPSLPKTAP